MKTKQPRPSRRTSVVHSVACFCLCRSLPRLQPLPSGIGAATGGAPITSLRSPSRCFSCRHSSVSCLCRAASNGQPPSFRFSRDSDALRLCPGHSSTPTVAATMSFYSSSLESPRFRFLQALSSPTIGELSGRFSRPITPTRKPLSGSAQKQSDGTATANHALQRTAPGVTACARTASCRPATDPLTTPTALRPTLNRLRPHRLRRPPPSLSLGALGVAARYMKSLVLLFLSLCIVACANTATSKGSDAYSNRIVGRWGHRNRIVTFHADGTWGVQRHEDAPEGIAGRRWRIEGNKLFLTFPSDNGVGTPVHMDTVVYTITSFTAQSFTITTDDGDQQEYDRAP